MTHSTASPPVERHATASVKHDRTSNPAAPRMADAVRERSRIPAHTRGVSTGVRGQNELPSGLLKFLLVLVIVSGLTCFYVWQASTISVIKDETEDMLTEIQRLEQENVSLMLEYAHLDAPSYIEAQANKLRMVPGQAPIYVRVPQLEDPRQGADPISGRDPQWATLLWKINVWLPEPAGSRGQQTQMGQ